MGNTAMVTQNPSKGAFYVQVCRFFSFFLMVSPPYILPQKERNLLNISSIVLSKKKRSSLLKTSLW